MMPADAIRIIGQAQDARYNVDQTVTHLIRVKFMVGTFGPFTEAFELDNYTAAARDQKLRERAEHIWVDPTPAA